MLISCVYLYTQRKVGEALAGTCMLSRTSPSLEQRRSKTGTNGWSEATASGAWDSHRWAYLSGHWILAPMIMKWLKGILIRHCILKKTSCRTPASPSPINWDSTEYLLNSLWWQYLITWTLRIWSTTVSPWVLFSVCGCQWICEMTLGYSSEQPSIDFPQP